MRPAVWRLLTLAICTAASLSAVVSFTSFVGMGGAPPWTGREGFDSSSAGAFRLRVTDLDHGGPAERAGLRPGDIIDIRTNTLQERLWITNRPLTGHPIPLLVHRGALTKTLVLVPDPYIGIGRWFVNANFLTSPFLTLLFAFFAALIAWRRSEVPEMRLLALTLAFIAVWNEAPGLPSWATPWAWPYVVAGFFGAVGVPAAIALSIAYAGSFARPMSRARRICHLLAYGSVAMWSAQYIAADVGLISLWFDPYSAVLSSLVPAYASAVGALTCCTFAFVASSGTERLRAAWTLVPVTIILYIGAVAYPVSFLISNSYFFGSVANSIQAGIQILAACALTYAVLSRRVIDIGFVLNRAVVFTIVSTIVIAAFVVVEWAASLWLSNVTHPTSAVIAMVVALFLGLSLRYIHRHVDRVVDGTIFRKRHEDETALRRFAHESAYISDRSELLARAVGTVKEHTDADDAAILVRDDTARYAGQDESGRQVVSENDAGIVALRAWRKPVDLHRVSDSRIRGEFAFPMISRGELIGTLVCGSKPGGEAYAPDELDALLLLSQGVGSALGVLEAGHTASTDALARELADVRAAAAQERESLLRALLDAQRERDLLLRGRDAGATPPVTDR